jgi:signal transduction histidine kinase
MEQGPARRPALPTVTLAAAGAAVVSLLVVAVPWLRMSVEAPSVRVALETGGTLLAVATAGLLWRQVRARRRTDHLWLMAGLVILALTALAVATLVVAGAWGGAEARYAIGGNLAGTVLLAVAALAPARPSRRGVAPVLVAAAALALAAFAAGALLATDSAGAARASVQVATAAAIAAAAAGLTRRGEPLLRWVAVAVVLGGIAKIDYALFPPVGADSVHLGDALRVVGWGVLLVGVIGEARTQMHVRAQAALERERRRLARELHDGVAQELAFIRRRATRLAALPDGAEITAAAERGLEDSRRAIEALVPPACEPLDVALERLGARLAAECDLEVQVNVRADAELGAEIRAELDRIICEAVRNAANHGGARHVRVDLTDAPLAVRIIDDGSGFADGASSGLGVAGYGLIAMRERAEQVGGELSLESVRGAGTLVQVVLP